MLLIVDGAARILPRRRGSWFRISHCMPLAFSSSIDDQARQGVYQVQEYRTARQTKAVLRWDYPEGGFNGMMTRHEAAAVIGIE